MNVRLTAFRNQKFWKAGWPPVGVFTRRYTEADQRKWADYGLYFVMWTVVVGVSRGA